MGYLQTLPRLSPDAADLRQIAFDGHTRAPNTFALLGTSRIAAKFQDPAQRNKANSGWMNWADGILRGINKPLITVGSFAVSGTRTDQFDVASALGTLASNILFDGPVNSIAQAVAGYTPVSGPNTGIPITIANVATACIAEYKALFKTINDAGARVFYVWERGAAGFSTAQIAALNDFNRMLADYIQNGDDFRGAPSVIVLDPTPYTVVTSNATAIALKSSQDGTHDDVPAAKALGTAFAAKIAPYLREMPGHRLSRLTQSKSGVGSRSLVTNAGLAGSAAAGGTGNSGNVPTNCTTSQTGGVTAVYSVQATTADADGNTWGNEVKIVATATAAGTCRLILALDRTNIAVGDRIKAGCEIDVMAGASALQGVSFNSEWFPATGGTSPMIDMSPSTIGLDTGGYTGLAMEPDPLLITTFTGQPYTNVAITLQFNGAGSATVLFRKPWAERT